MFCHEEAGLTGTVYMGHIVGVHPALYILTGYTAVGKTRLSLDWAIRNNAEILSCDSLLFYRHMDIGTAKPSQDDLSEVPHHLINVTDPSSQYSINEYLVAARTAIRDIHSRGKQVLVVGGSGFYLNAFFAAVVDDVDVDPSLKATIEAEFEALPLKESVEKLRALNPGGLGNLDTDNPRRVLKAWLRCVASGKTLAQLWRDFEGRAGAFDSYERRILVLTRPRADLEDRVRLRVDGMLSDGLEQEVRTLLGMGIERNPSAARAIGYRETLACLKGELPGNQLAETISANTRKLLKKQRTWFKKYLPRAAVCDVSSMESLPDDWYVLPPGKPEFQKRQFF